MSARRIKITVSEKFGQFNSNMIDCTFDEFGNEMAKCTTKKEFYEKFNETRDKIMTELEEFDREETGEIYFHQLSMIDKNTFYFEDVKGQSEGLIMYISNGLKKEIKQFGTFKYI